MKTTLSPDQIDQHVGARIRIRRKDLGVSQQGLAEGLGLTFQQVQKYERGSNRVSASKLYEIAALLEAPVAWFFDGLTESGSAQGERDAADTSSLLTRFASATGAREVMAAWPNVPRAQQTLLANLVRELGAPAADEEV
jgi:transcriptional regulator with XRE-family HTH domain